MNLSRRSFLGGILAVGCAPAIVRVSSIMPVKPVVWGNPTNYGISVERWVSDFGDLDVVAHKSGYITEAQLNDAMMNAFLDGGTPQYAHIHPDLLEKFRALS